jgi:hypothetical protein
MLKVLKRLEALRHLWRSYSVINISLKDFAKVLAYIF